MNIVNDFQKLFVIENDFVDFSDQLNGQYTVNILIVLTFVISNAISFLNKTINCAVPINFSANQETYTNLACYVNDKYHVTDTEPLTLVFNSSLISTIDLQNQEADESSEQVYKLIDGDYKQIRPSRIATHYIWIEYILLGQAFSFWILKQIWWSLLNRFTFIDLNEVISAAKGFKSVNRAILGKRKEKYYLRYVFARMKKYLVLKEIRTSMIFTWYLIMKLVSIVNIVGQILFINMILELNFNIQSLMKLEQILNSTYFPYKSICALQVKDMSSIHVYAIVCNLPVNYFIQFILAFLLLWYLLLLVANLASVIKWLVELRQSSRCLFVRGYLSDQIEQNCFHLDYELYDNECSICETRFCHFVVDFLSFDLLFLIKIVAQFSKKNKHFLTVHLFKHFWNLYLRK